MTRIIRTETEIWNNRPHRINVMRCDCGQEVWLYSVWSNECDCGLCYNGSGQQLAPRSQWGEETGERFD
jgi:hypothetical protein